MLCLHSQLAADMRDLQYRGDGDVTVRFDDGEARAHSVILGARSPVILAMLKAPMQEGSTRIVEMRCCRNTGMAFLEFIYTGELVRLLAPSLRQVCDLGELVHYYDVKGINRAFAFEQIEALIDKFNEAFNPASDTYWEDAIGFLQEPHLPNIVRELVISSVVKDNLKWPRGVFLALCFSDTLGATDVHDMCMDEIRSYFSTFSTPTPSRPSGPGCCGPFAFGVPYFIPPAPGAVLGAMSNGSTANGDGLLNGFANPFAGLPFGVPTAGSGLFNGPAGSGGSFGGLSGGGLFGSPTAGGGLFHTAGGGLFGGGSAGGLFGSPAAGGSLFHTAGGGMFGGGSAGGFFGSAATGGGLFNGPAGSFGVNISATPATDGGLSSAHPQSAGPSAPPQQSTSPRSSPVSDFEGQPKRTGLPEEFAENRLAYCVRRTSGALVLRKFISFQSEVTRVMTYRTGVVVPAEQKQGRLVFNIFQQDVHAYLAGISDMILRITEPTNVEATTQDAVVELT